MELKAGQYVRHAKYGWGTIVDYNRQQTVVIFRGVGIKKLQTDPRNFALVGGEPPKKKSGSKAGRHT
jgi:hypothetical protein